MTLTLEQRMRRHEAATRAVLPRRTYSLLRVDGRAFHTYLRGCKRPYDEAFMADMDAAAIALCEEIAGARLAYVQSDEISILFTDFASQLTEPWFGGVVAKQTSIAAAVATAALNERRPGKRALFDARVFTITDPTEVAAYFQHRQHDATRNSIAMSAQAAFSPRRLRGLNGPQMVELLEQEKGIRWADYPTGFRRGRVVARAYGNELVTYVHGRTREQRSTTVFRSWWKAEPAPEFTPAARGSWLAERIPELPSFTAGGGR
ncbi:tRNA(His) guanylyltransferase Thg1 family protein [Streptomyces sp. NPDC046977]|uniref:tRNA(His) guanylyltransferase Thg1 family protein n=1 Tax=Streptomyces sp. NPDC046977 TaxID=3154703 RepID=UPI0034097191